MPLALNPATDSAGPTLRRRTLCVLGGLAAFGPISTDLYLPALPQTATSLHTSAALAQLTLTASVIGLGAGQLVIGPLSDRFGRRLPLLIGLTMFIAFSLGCAAAPNVIALILLRFGQALGASAGLVISRTVVRDVVEDDLLRRAFSMLTIVSSMGPVVAPLIGSQLTRIIPWRGDFLVLTAIGATLLVGSALWVAESLPPARRHSARGDAWRSYRILLADRHFLLHVALFAAAFGVLFSYIAESPFALQVTHGLTPPVFGVIFAANAVAMMICSRIRLADAGRNINAALATMTVGVALVSVSSATHVLAALLPGFALVCCSWGLLAPSATALILTGHADRAGTATAIQGAAQFLVAGIAGPLVGLGGPANQWPLVAVMATLTISGVLTWAGSQVLPRAVRAGSP